MDAGTGRRVIAGSQGSMALGIDVVQPLLPPVHQSTGSNSSTSSDCARSYTIRAIVPVNAKLPV